MPNRIIKESIRTSRSIGALSDFDFRLWVYLITYVDDYGRGSADPELLKGVVYTRRKSVTEGQIYEGIGRLANAGMVNLYEVGGEPYLYFPNWASHQRIQTKKSRFPEPPAVHGESPCPTVDNEIPPSESESNTNTNTNTKKNTSYSSPDLHEGPGKKEAESPEPARYKIILNDKTYFDVTQPMIDEYRELYPAVDVEQEIRNMVGWCESNPANRKTRGGVKRFITSWLIRSQNKAPRQSAQTGSRLRKDIYENV